MAVTAGSADQQIDILWSQVGERIDHGSLEPNRGPAELSEWHRGGTRAAPGPRESRS